MTIAQALRRLFIIMKTTKDVVSARELTQAFGWGPQQLDEAQDPIETWQALIDYLDRVSPSNELRRILCSNIIDKGRGEDVWRS